MPFATRCACMLVVLNLLAGCGQKKETTSEPPADSVATPSADKTPVSVSLNKRLLDLGLTAASDWRGISLGDDFSKVKSTEKAEQFETDAKHTGYTVEFPNLETADMLYYQTNNRVSSIVVDLFLNKQESVTSYRKDLTDYFTGRYGDPKTTATESTWTGPKGEIVTLKEVSKGKDFGLKINMMAGKPAA